MQITQESDYAIRIVYCLAKSKMRRDARSISEEMGVTLRFSLKILGKLVAAGIVSSYKGNKGGYELAKDPRDITFKDVIEAVEGSYYMIRCLNEETPCNRGASETCSFRKIFCEITEEVNRRLEEATFARLLTQEK